MARANRNELESASLPLIPMQSVRDTTQEEPEAEPCCFYLKGLTKAGRFEGKEISLC
jgi:hypothetical protein